MSFTYTPASRFTPSTTRRQVVTRLLMVNRRREGRSRARPLPTQEPREGSLRRLASCVVGRVRRAPYLHPSFTLFRLSLRLRNFKVFPGFTKDFSFHVPPQRSRRALGNMLSWLKSVNVNPKGRAWGGGEVARALHPFQTLWLSPV